MVPGDKRPREETPGTSEVEREHKEANLEGGASREAVAGPEILGNV